MTRADQFGNPKPLTISSEEQFNALMEEIDKELIAERVGIPARPLAALSKVSSRCKMALELVSSDTPIVPGVFTPRQISVRVFHWTKKRYGDRLNLPFTVGRVVMPLRGSLYCIKCPVVYGSANFVCEPKTFGQPRVKIGVRSIPTCNILDLIDGFTPDLAQSLTGVEVVQIGLVHASAMGTFTAMHAVSDVQYVSEALGDFSAAVNHLMEHDPQAGLSKWASLQAAEKLIKAYIAAKGQRVDRIHSLQDLANEAAKYGFPPPPPRYLKDVQCKGGVRYGEEPVSVDQAVTAHLVSLEICEVAARSIGRALNRYVPKSSQPMIDGMPAKEFLAKHVK